MDVECGRSLAFFFCVSERVCIICYIFFSGGGVFRILNETKDSAKSKLDVDSVWQKVIAICIVSGLWFACINSWQEKEASESSNSHQNDKNAGLCNSGLTGRSIILTQDGTPHLHPYPKHFFSPPKSCCKNALETVGDDSRSRKRQHFLLNPDP